MQQEFSTAQLTTPKDKYLGFRTCFTHWGPSIQIKSAHSIMKAQGDFVSNSIYALVPS